MGALPEQLETPRLRLRVPVPRDADLIFAAYAQVPEVCRYLVWAPHESVEVTRRFITRCLECWRTGNTLPYVIADAESDDVIGMIEVRLGSTGAELGYVLAPFRWGKGLMPEAIEAVAGACLERPATFRVQAFCDVDNRASARALEKSGFRLEGRLERYTVHPNVSPEPRAVLMYARVR